MRRNDLSRLETTVREANPVPRPLDLVDSEESATVTLLVRKGRLAMTTTHTLQPQHTEPRPNPPRRRVWAFAAAFAAVVVAVGLAALLLSGTESSVIDQPATTIDQAATSTTNWFNVPMQAPATARVSQFIEAPDGTEWRVKDGELGRYDGTQFTSVGAPETSDGSNWIGDEYAVTTDGMVWTSGCCGWDPVGGSLARFDGTNWELMRPLGDKELPAVALAATPDGSLWAVIVDYRQAKRVDYDPLNRYGLVEWTLARFDGSDWTLYPQATEFTTGFPGELEASGNTVLLAAGNRGANHDPPFMGVVVFDGQSWRHYLDDEMVIFVTVKPDGTVLADAVSGSRRFDL